MKTSCYWKSALAATLFCGAVQAQIYVGQGAGFNGPVASGVKETTDGARLWFDAVHASGSIGGIGGQQIELVSLDDTIDPELAAGNAKTHVEAHKVVTLFLTRGTPHTQAVLPVLWIGSAKAVAKGGKSLRAAKPAAHVVTLSNNAASGFTKELGEPSRGVIPTQLFPHERSIAYPMVKEAQDLAKAKGAVNDRAGLDFADLSIADLAGRFVR